MGRDDFVSSKKKSAFLGKAKKGGKGSVFGGGDEGESSNEGLQKQFYSLMDSIVFKDELVAYLSSVINNTEPNEYVYDDLRVAATSVKVGGAAPGFEAFLGTTKTYLFDKTGDEEVHFNCQLPHSYEEGTDIIPHVHWAPVDTDTGDVVWGLEYTWQNIDGTFPATTTIVIADDADGTAYKHQVATFAAISGTGKTISSILVCRLFRDVSADDYNEDAAFLEVDFHFRKDSRGSGTATVK